MFGEWVVTKEATCLEEGSQKRVCSECDFEETEKIDMLEHAWATEWQSDATGHWHLSACANHDPVKSAVADHSFGEWEVIKEATHLTKGSRKKTCSDCKYELVEDIDELPEHTYAEVWTYDYTQHWHATTCGHDVKGDVADHTPGSDGFCTVCGIHPAQLTTLNVAHDGYTDGSAVEFTVSSGKVYYVKATCDKVGTYTFTYVPENEEDTISVKLVYNNIGGAVQEEFAVPYYGDYDLEYSFSFNLYEATDVYLEISDFDGEAAAPLTGTLFYEYEELSGNWLTLDEEKDIVLTAEGKSFYFIAPKSGMYFMDFDPDVVEIVLVRDGGDGDMETLESTYFSLNEGEVVLLEMYPANWGNHAEFTLSVTLDHEHTPAAQWQYDGTYHWQACTHSGCTAQFNKAEHDSNNPEVVCSVCGGMHVHTWSDKSYVEWHFDEEKHWHYSTCSSHDEVRKDEVPHDELTEENNFTCVCGFVHNHTNSGVQSDATHHWYASTCKDHEEVIYWSTWQGVTLGKAEHTYDNGVCTACNYYEATQNTVTGVTADNAVTKEIALTQDDSYSRIDFTVTTAGKYTLTYTGEKTIYIKYTYHLSGETYPVNQTIMLPSNGSRTHTIDLSGITDSVTVKISVYAYIYSEANAVNGTLKFSFGEPAEVTPEDPTEMTTAGATVNINGLNGGLTILLKGQDEATANGFVLGHTYKFTVNNNKAVFVDGRQTVVELEIVYSVGTSTINLTTTDGSALTDVTISVQDLGEEAGGDEGGGNTLTLGEAKSFKNAGYEGIVFELVITEAGNYTLTFGGADANDVWPFVGTDLVDGEFDYESEIQANMDDSYTLAVGTYYICVTSNKLDENYNTVPVSGTITVAKVAA